MSEKKKSGFDRLRGLASTGALAGMAALGLLPPSSVRAGPGVSSSFSYSSTTVSMRNSWIWQATCYQSVLSDESLTTSKGLALNTSGDSTGLAVYQGYLNTDVTGSIMEWKEAFGDMRSGNGSAGVLGLAVNGSVPTNCDGSLVVETSDPDYDQFTETRTGIVAGIDLKRVITYFEFRPVIRGFYSFTNTTGADINMTAHVINSLNSADNTTVVASSDGNTSHGTSDSWVITYDDTDNTSPHVTTYTGASDELVVAYGDGSKVNEGHMVARYDLTVPAGETVSVVAFIELNPDAETAQSQIAVYASPDTLAGEDLLLGLTEDEIATIVNGSTTSRPMGDDEDEGPFGGTAILLTLGMGLLGLRRRKRA